MRKFIGCDVLAVLNEIMRHNTEHWQEDFNIDKEILTEAAEENDRTDKRFLWMSRNCGTHCLKEKDVYLRGTSQHNCWRYYNEETKDKVIAYAVEIGGLKDGKLIGDLYELDYSANAENVRCFAVPIENVKLYCSDGSQVLLPYKDGWHSQAEEYTYEKSEFIPEKINDYNAALAVARSDRLTARNYANWNIDKLKMEYGEHSEDAFSIYQLISDEHRFQSYATMQGYGYEPTVDEYEMVYTDELNSASLNDIYTQFNIDHPKDYVGYSLSVSDVIVLIQNGSRKAYFVDSVGFKELPDFFSGSGGMQMQKDEMEM